MKFVTITILLILKLNISFGQNITKTVLWQVTKNNLKDTSYLFGTYHSFTSNFFNYYPEIPEYINQKYWQLK